MLKQFRKFLAIFLVLFILMLIIPGSFAEENATDLQLDSSNETVSADPVNIYFNPSASQDGDGSYEHPYKTMDVSKLKSNANIFLEEGQYSIQADSFSLENVNIYGKNPERTYIKATNPNQGLTTINVKGFFSLSNITFINSHFDVNGQITLKNSIFDTDTNKISANGGFIESNYYYTSMVTMDNCKFYDYFANNGGVVYMANGVVNINDCEFHNCNAYWPNTESHGEGGAVYITGGSLEVYNSLFKSCQALGSASAVYVMSSSATISNCIFQDNRAFNGQGAVLNNYSNVKVLGCIFKNNTAKYGSAIANYYSSISVSNSNFEDNVASIAGGAIYNQENSLVLVGSKFKNNQADAFGGAVAAYSCSIIINDTSFENEFTNHIGGALSSESTTLKLNNVNMTNCHADFGAAVVGLMSDTYLNNVIATSNSAEYEGGAFYQIYGSVTISNSKFKSNKADKGGAIYLDYVGINSFTKNEFTNNQASLGSAYYLVGTDETKVKDNTLKNNAAYCTDSRELFVGSGDYTMFDADDTQYSEFPESYCLRDYGYVTSVKNQGEGGYCWAFTAMAVLESCILKANGGTYDFSENNLINVNKLYSDYGLSTLSQGGSMINALGYLLSWLGPVDDSYDEYSAFSRLSPVLNSDMHVQNVLFIDIDNQTDLNPIKEALMEYGAVGSFLYWTDLPTYLDGSNYYYDGALGSYINHAVTLVGWDDNYAKENFVLTPPGDGAWIIKNSWGPEIGDGGYFYVSYYCDTVNDVYSRYSDSLNKLYTIILNDTVRFDKNYQYDYAGVTCYYKDYAPNTWLKNVFVSEGDEFLEGVSTYFMQDSEYDVYIYLNGEMVHTQGGETKSGYYTVVLDQFIPLKSDDVFEVVFNIRSLDGSGVSLVTVQADDVTQYEIKSGISFYSDVKDHWVDFGSGEALCIKAFTVLSKVKTVMDLKASYNGYNPVDITATIRDDKGNPVTSGTVTFNVEGKDYTVNVANGVAKLTHNFEKGESTITATYMSRDYDPARESVKVNVAKIDVGVDVDITSHLNTISVSVTVSDDINENVEVIVNGKTYEAKLINGKATLNITVEESGNQEIKVKIGSALYDGGSDESVDVYFKKLNIISADFACVENRDATYSIQLVDDSNHPVSGKTVNFNLNGKNTEAVTDANGKASLTFNLPAGIYEITSSYAGDELTIPSEATNSIRVKAGLTAGIEVSNYYNNVTIGISLSKNVNAQLLVSAGSYKESVNATNGKATLKLYNLANGNYKVEVSEQGDEYDFTNAYSSFSINYIRYKIISSDFTTSENSNAAYTVRLVDSSSSPVSGKKIKFSLNGKNTEVTTNANGEASLTINLASGNYTVTSSFAGDDATLPLSVKNTIRVQSVLSATVNVNKKSNNVTLDIALSKSVNADLTVSVNSKDYQVSAQSGKAKLELTNLANGKYTVKVNLANNQYSFVEAQASFEINVAKSKIVSDDFVTAEKSNEVYTVRLVDEKSSPLAGRTVRFNLNGKNTEVKTNDNGEASINVNLIAGNYTVTSTFDGDDKYLPASATNSIKVKINLTSNIDIKKISNCVTIKVVLENNLNLDLKISVNGKTQTFNSKDTFKLENLKNGNYDIEVSPNNDNYVLSSHSASFNINVIETSLQASDVNKYFGSSESFTVTLLDKNGKAVSNKVIKFTLNGNVLQASTDANGKASIPIDLGVGTYTVTAKFEGTGEYSGCEISKNIVVKSTIITKNVKAKKGKTIKFKATLLKPDGSVYPKKKLTFNFNGKKYKVKANKKGVATLKIATKKLKPGKYTIQTTFKKLTVSNTVKIKK